MVLLLHVELTIAIFIFTYATFYSNKVSGMWILAVFHLMVLCMSFIWITYAKYFKTGYYTPSKVVPVSSTTIGSADFTSQSSKK